MAELEADDRPWAGAGPIGALVAGRETPVGSGLTPAGKRWAELQTMNLLIGIAETSNELKVRCVTAYSNMMVSQMQMRATALEAAINGMRIHQQDSQRITNFYDSLLRTSELAAVGRGLGVDETARGRLDESMTAVISGAQDNIDSIIGDYRGGKFGPQESQDAIQTTLNALISATVKDIDLSVVANSRSAMSGLHTSNATINVIIDTKNYAKSVVLQSADKAYDEYIKALSSDRSLRPLLSVLNNDELRNDFITSASKSAISNNQDLYEPTYAEEKKAEQIRSDAQQERTILKEKVESMAVGVSPELQQAVGEMVRAGDALIEGGIEGFLEEAGKDPDPLSLQLAKQEAEASLEEIKNPTDPLSQVINNYAAAIPHFDSYMAAMGFNDVYKAINYFDKHKETE